MFMNIMNIQWTYVYFTYSYLGRIFLDVDLDMLQTESDVNINISNLWTAINRLSTIWKSNLSDEIKK